MALLCCPGGGGRAGKGHQAHQRGFGCCARNDVFCPWPWPDASLPGSRRTGEPGWSPWHHPEAFAGCALHASCPGMSGPGLLPVETEPAQCQPPVMGTAAGRSLPGSLHQERPPACRGRVRSSSWTLSRPRGVAATQDGACACLMLPCGPVSRRNRFCRYRLLHFIDFLKAPIS